MKRVKRLISILLVAVMMLAMTTTVFAADVTTTVTVNNLSGHTFAAYQIFTGDYSETTDLQTNITTGTLSNITWGDGVTSATLLEKLQKDTTVVVTSANNNNNGDITVASLFKDVTTADDVAAILEKYSTNSTLVNAFVNAAYAAKSTKSTEISTNTTSMAAGYYLIVDTTTNVGASGVSPAAYNNALLQVVGSTVTIDKKTDAPSVEKKVKEEDYADTNTGYLTGYNDVADYDIGDAISYQLIGTIPDTSEYSYYNYIFTDTLSEGLTYNSDSIHVYLADYKDSKTGWKEISKTVDTHTNYTVRTASIPSTASSYANGTTLTVSFADILKLQDDAGETIDVSTTSDYKYIIVEYTATLNDKAVIGLDGNPNEVYLTYSSNPNSLSDGDKDDETKDTPKDRVIVFTYELDVTKVDSTDETKKLKDAEFILYIEVGGEKYYWTGSTTSEPWSESDSKALTLKSDANGTFSVKGLDDGTYYLKETKAPTGYNLSNNVITLVITATTANGQNWTENASLALTALTISVDGGANTNGVLSSGVVSATVKNTPGSGLPVTGGMGTTILYIIGAILVIGAGVLLVTRRRLSRQ